MPEVFEQNPYMTEIYPQEESRTVLEVFKEVCPFGAVEKR